jgi:hypothetical protein
MVEDIFHEDMSRALASIILTLKRWELDLLDVLYLMQHILALLARTYQS